MTHPNAKLLEKFYAQFLKGEIAEALSACDDKITFQVMGKSKVAGKYNKQTYVSEFLPRLAELSNGTFSLEVHDIMASDQHAVVLVSEFVTRSTEKVQLRAAHVWRIENGKPVAWYEYPRDLYQYDEVWS